METVGWLVLGVLVIVAVTSVAHHVGVAPPLLLVVIGVGVSLLPAVPAFHVEPRLILAVILPPLLYSGAVSLPAMDFRRDLTTISALSVGLVVVSAVVVGLVVSALLPGLGLAGGIALGAVVSPTDAVATRIVRSQRVSPRIVTVLEGESLLNDASALVLLRSAVAAITATVTAGQVAWDFTRAVVVAVVVGWLVGKGALWARAHLRPATAGVAVSLVVPYVAYLPSEQLGGSGLVAAVTAGLVTGTSGARTLRAEDRMTEQAVWRTLELLLEGAVFLLMGLALFGLLEDLRGAHGDLSTTLWLAALTGGLAIVVRAAFVTPSLALLRRRTERQAGRRGRLAAFEERLDHAPGGSASLVGLPDETGPRLAGRLGAPGGVGVGDVARVEGRARALRSMVRRRIADIDYLAAESFGWREGGLLVWAGMRGAITLAAAQSLPAATPHRSVLVLVAFVVAAGTLLLQGGTLPALIRRLGLARDDDPDERTDLEAVQAELARAAADRLADPALRRPDGRPYGHAVLERVRRVSTVVLRRAEPEGGEERAAALAERAEEEALRLDLIDTQRRALLRLRSEGTYGSDALAEELRILDAEQLGLELRAVGPRDQD